jgi:hypothetical protein
MSPGKARQDKAQQPGKARQGKSRQGAPAKTGKAIQFAQAKQGMGGQGKTKQVKETQGTQARQ